MFLKEKYNFNYSNFKVNLNRWFDYTHHRLVDLAGYRKGSYPAFCFTHLINTFKNNLSKGELL